MENAQKKQKNKLVIKKLELVYFHSKNSGDGNEGSHRHIYSEVTLKENANGKVMANTVDNYYNHRELIMKFLLSAKNILSEQFREASSVDKKIEFKNPDQKRTERQVEHDLKFKKHNEGIDNQLKFLLKDIKNRAETTGASRCDKVFIKESLGKLIDNPYNPIDFKLDMDLALDLLSLIKIEKNWDFYGILFEKIYSFGSSDESDSIAEPYPNVLYVNYKTKEKCDKEKECDHGSCKNLDYNFEISILNEEGNELEKYDIFSVIDETTDKKRLDKYIAYVLLINSIQGYIHGTDDKGQINITFVCYPIFYLNSIHYIQIHIDDKSSYYKGDRPSSEEPPTLKDLHTIWENIHKILKSPFFRHLTLSIEQINAFSFQHYVRQYIDEKDKATSEDENRLTDKDIAYRIFKNNIGCLLPAQEEITKDRECLKGKNIIPIYDEETEEYFYIKLETDRFYEINKGFILEQATFLIENHWDWVKGRVDRLRKILKANEKSELSSIMVRNMSHNIGSHVLSSQSIYTNIDTRLEDLLKNKKEDNDEENMRNKKSTEPLNMFHSYLQTRMDFLARITSVRPNWGEPMLFVGGLLTGFFSQTILLNNLVLDQGGWEGGSIKFNITFSNGKKTTFAYGKETYNGDTESKWGQGNHDNDENYEDFLVSIPDGIIGAHAFYIFLEGMMRNSAKYGTNISNVIKGDKCFNIYITIKDKLTEDGEAFYSINIWDNLSTCNDDEGCLVDKKIKEAIKKDIVDNKGHRTKNLSLGITEMHEVCKFLIHPNGDKFNVHKEKDQGNYNLWVGCGDGNANEENQYIYNCNGTKDCKYNLKTKFLAYNFNIAKPKMVAVVGFKEKRELEHVVQYGIKRFNNLGEFLFIKSADKDKEILKEERAYQFLVIEGDAKNNDVALLEEYHWYLPQRILLARPSFPGSENHIKPVGRVVICEKEKFVFPVNIGSEDVKTRAIACEKFILYVYETWINNKWSKKLSSDENDISIFLAFSRNKDNIIFNSWEKHLNIIKNEGNKSKLQKKLNLHLYGQDKDENLLEIYSLKGLKADNNNLDILYDGHNLLRRSDIFDISHSLFIQEIGGNCKKIFETLASPPRGLFNFKYFLLGLVEAALVKVLIVDERIAEHSIDIDKDGDLDYDKFNELQSVRLRVEYVIDGRPLNENLTKIVEKAINDNEIKIGNLNDETKEKFDFIVIHAGLCETNENYFKRKNLYELAPSIINISGRGTNVSKNKDIIKWPFLEFSILKDSIYPSLSKYHLVKSIMSSIGGANNE